MNINNALASLITNFARATGHGPSFVGVTYTSKSTGETARFTMNIGTSYLNLLRKSLAELESAETPTELDVTAKAAVRASLEKSIAAHEIGQQNEDYTKKGKYRTLTTGVKEYVDGTCEIVGIVVAKKVLVAGTPIVRDSKALTIAKGKIEKNLSKAKWRTLCVDAGNLDSVRVGGNEIEVEGSILAGLTPQSGVVSVAVGAPVAV